MSRKTLNHIVILLLTISVFFSEKVVAQVFALDSMLNTIERNNPELRKFDAQVKAYRTYADGGIFTPTGTEKLRPIASPGL